VDAAETFMSAIELKYMRLSPEKRDRRRKVSDAIAVLCAEAGFGERHRATIRVMPLRLVSAELVGLVEVLFEAPWVPCTYSVELRTAPQFRGRGSRGYQERPIIELNRAVVDATGLVTLADNTELSAVEVLSAPMLTEPSELDWRIIHLVLKTIEGGEQCYRSLGEGLPSATPDHVEDVRFLDCQMLPALNPPPLNDIVKGIARLDPTLHASGQKIADALRKFGVRVPSPRPRLKKSSASAKA
jgi:hypothetical protein